ncbi:unnamed protein product, partial [Meganyctiphanes norvegica]
MGAPQEKQESSNSLWNSLPSVMGIVSLPVTAPINAAKFTYRTGTAAYGKLVGKERELCGKVVMITGASSGLGEALAHALYKRGCRLILAARNIKKLEEIKETLIKFYQPPEVYLPMVVKLDLENINGIPTVVKHILANTGKIDVLINNAGISYRGSSMDTDVSVDIKVMVVNYFGQIALTKAVLPDMLDRKSGHIVSIGSIQGKMAIPYRSCYTASKHALQAFFDTLRAEIADSNVKVTVVSPGYIATNLSVNAITSDGSLHGEMDATTASGMKPSYVAEKVVDSIIWKQEDVILAPLLHRLVICLRVLMPSLYRYIMRLRADKQKYIILKKIKY